MKLKFAIGVALMMGVSAAANAAPAAPGISLGVVITPVFKLIDTGGALLTALHQPAQGHRRIGGHQLEHAMQLAVA